MRIDYIEPQDPRALLELHGQEMSDSLAHSMEFSNTFFFGMIFLNAITQRPVFVLFTKNCNWLHSVPTYCHRMKIPIILIMLW